MKTVGLPISHKENEKRRALIPKDLNNIINQSLIYIEKGYGLMAGYSDADYLMHGDIKFVSRKEVLENDIICDPKVGDGNYLPILSNQVVFGWIHAIQNREITDTLLKQKLTAYAWEDMYEDGRHVFWRNNEIAGEAAVMHACLCHGGFGPKTKIAVLGKGNTARGALRILNQIGAKVVVYDRKTEKLFQKELAEYDAIVNAILWDTSRNDHIIYKQDLKRMKKNAIIIDISCDRNGGIETSIPTTIESPIYVIEGIAHYVVDHTPSLLHKRATEIISKIVSKHIDFLIEGNEDNVTLNKCKIVDGGIISDERIIQFQRRPYAKLKSDKIPI